MCDCGQKREKSGRNKTTIINSILGNVGLHDNSRLAKQTDPFITIQNTNVSLNRADIGINGHLVLIVSRGKTNSKKCIYQIFFLQNSFITIVNMCTLQTHHRSHHMGWHHQCLFLKPQGVMSICGETKSNPEDLRRMRCWTHPSPAPDPKERDQICAYLNFVCSGMCGFFRMCLMSQQVHPQSLTEALSYNRLQEHDLKSFNSIGEHGWEDWGHNTLVSVW